MPYHIKKQSRLVPEMTVYYVGNLRWSDRYDTRLIIQNESDADNLIINDDGTNGAFKGASVVSE